MIEQLISTQGVPAPQSSEALKQPVAEASPRDAMRFDIEFVDSLKAEASNKTPNDDLLTIKIDGIRVDSPNTEIVNNKVEPTALNPLSKMDASYKDIMQQMNNVVGMDQFPAIQKKAPQVGIRSNVSADKAETEFNLKNLLSEQKAMMEDAQTRMDTMSRWKIKTQMWSTNITILTSVVSQASQGLKTLFRSAG
ncbi:MAG: hypothetical protein KAH22_01835 [Thiotrichaceae bacterium]|nr:hypothetical protein [Thiotrichaceae bacterium]